MTIPLFLTRVFLRLYFSGSCTLLYAALYFHYIHIFSFYCYLFYSSRYYYPFLYSVFITLFASKHLLLNSLHIFVLLEGSMERRFKKHFKAGLK